LAELSLKKLHFAVTDRTSRVELYATFMAASGFLTALALIGAGYRLENSAALAFLCIAAALAQRGQIDVTGAHKVSISLFPIILGAVLCGPLGAMAVSVSSMLGEETRPYTRWVLYASSRSLTGAAAGLVAAAFSLETFPSILAATATAAVCTQVLDLAFAALAFSLRGHGSPVAALRETGPLSLTGLPLYVPAVSLLAWGVQLNAWWVLPLFLVPAIAAQRSFVLYQGERKLAGDLAEANKQLERANLKFASSLVATLDARDEYTAGHSAAVAVYARDIATRLGLPDDQIRLVHLCGLVHDIGKIGLPPGLLEKPGALTLDERRQMEDHAVIGWRILAKGDYAEIANVVRHHHERVDGQGYPDGLAGDDIPLLSRIIAVADAYNAMTSDRPYRDAMPSQVARMRLAQAVESQFDTSVTAAFEAILTASDEAYRSGCGFDFVLEGQELDSHRTTVPVSLRAAHVA
jgi:putative nucleotidyltransferase with HDIG domain